MFLLDTNVLVALIDSNHLNHVRAHSWFRDVGQFSWATCPITENGVIRILSKPLYPNTPGSPAVVARLLSDLIYASGHSFWPDRISLLDRSKVNTTELAGPSWITDTYLFALAKINGGKLATFDMRMSVLAVVDGADAITVIP